MGAPQRPSPGLIWSKRPSESELRIHFNNGSTIVVNGAFQPDSLRGVGLDLLILDEFASMKPEAWTEVFRPALADRQGRALFIGTPKGRNHFYEHFDYAANDPAWQAFQFTTADGALVSNAELLSAARELDPDSYRQEFAAEFISTGRHRVYYTFDPAIHVRPVSFEPRSSSRLVSRFQRQSYVHAPHSEIGRTVYVLDEIVLRDGHTEAACQAFFQRVEPFFKQVRYDHWPLEVDVYGDASGYQKRTSAAETDWVIIRQFFGQLKGTFRFSLRSTTANPPVRDRVNCVNRMLRTQSDDARLFIDPRCRELIKDLEQVAWQTDATGAATSDIDKSDRLRTHTSDALGYYIAQAFPLKPLIGYQNTGRIL